LFFNELQTHHTRCRAFQHFILQVGSNLLAMQDHRMGWGDLMATESATKNAAHRKTTRTYSPAAQKDVETEMKAMKAGELKSGRSGKTVTNPKQAIAIGLSKARKEGKKVPPPPK